MTGLGTIFSVDKTLLEGAYLTILERGRDKIMYVDAEGNDREGYRSMDRPATPGNLIIEDPETQKKAEIHPDQISTTSVRGRQPGTTSEMPVVNPYGTGEEAPVATDFPPPRDTPVEPEPEAEPEPEPEAEPVAVAGPTTFKPGDKITWQDEAGNTLTGTVDTDSIYPASPIGPQTRMQIVPDTGGEVVQLSPDAVSLSGPPAPEATAAPEAAPAPEAVPEAVPEIKSAPVPGTTLGQYPQTEQECKETGGYWTDGKCQPRSAPAGFGGSNPVYAENRKTLTESSSPYRFNTSLF